MYIETPYRREQIKNQSKINIINAGHKDELKQYKDKIDDPANDNWPTFK